MHRCQWILHLISHWCNQQRDCETSIVEVAAALERQPDGSLAPSPSFGVWVPHPCRLCGRTALVKRLQ